MACGHQAPLSVGILQERVLEVAVLSYRELFPTQGLNLSLLMSLALAGVFFTTRVTWEARLISC